MKWLKWLLMRFTKPKTVDIPWLVDRDGRIRKPERQVVLRGKDHK